MQIIQVMKRVAPTYYFFKNEAYEYIVFVRSQQDCDNLWWDAFTTEFFEDDAMLTITFCLEDGPKRYSNVLFCKVTSVVFICLYLALID